MMRNRLQDSRLQLPQPSAQHTEDEEQNLSAAQCEELATYLDEDAARFPIGVKNEQLLQLAQSYRTLATIKRRICGNVN